MGNEASDFCPFSPIPRIALEIGQIVHAQMEVNQTGVDSEPEIVMGCTGRLESDPTEAVVRIRPNEPEHAATMILADTNHVTYGGRIVAARVAFYEPLQAPLF